MQKIDIASLHEGHTRTHDRIYYLGIALWKIHPSTDRDVPRMNFRVLRGSLLSSSRNDVVTHEKNCEHCFWLYKHKTTSYTLNGTTGILSGEHLWSFFSTCLPHWYLFSWILLFECKAHCLGCVSCALDPVFIYYFGNSMWWDALDV